MTERYLQIQRARMILPRGISVSMDVTSSTSQLLGGGQDQNFTLRISTYQQKIPIFLAFPAFCTESGHKCEQPEKPIAIFCHLVSP